MKTQPSVSTTSQVASIGRRLRAELPTKIAVLLGLAIGICVPYFLLQRIALFPTRSVPVTPLDAWIPFEPTWVWVYGSIALLVPLAPLLAIRPEDLVRYARGLALLCVTCFAIFLVAPVLGPRPPESPPHPVYSGLVAIDRAFNSMPSLHAGLALYSVLFGYRIVRDDLSPRTRACVWLAAAVWSAAILYSTVATRQHWALDLPPGMLIAWLAHRWAWRTG